MDSTTDHLDPVTHLTPADEIRDADHVAACKDRLRKAARAIDPLAPLRKHPLLTMGTAGAIGIVAGSPEAARTVRGAMTSGAIRSALRLASWQFGRHRNGAPKDESSQTPGTT